MPVLPTWRGLLAAARTEQVAVGVGDQAALWIQTVRVLKETSIVGVLAYPAGGLVDFEHRAVGARRRHPGRAEQVAAGVGDQVSRWRSRRRRPRR